MRTYTPPTESKGIHVSDVRTFRSCRRKFKWSSRLYDNMEPIVPYAPFYSGRAVHYALEELYGPEKTPLMESVSAFVTNERKLFEEASGPLWPQEEEMVREQDALVEDILGHYDLWRKLYVGRFNDQDLDIVAMEVPFTVPLYRPDGTISPDIHFSGRFDGLAIDRETGAYWIFETKTTRSIEQLRKTLINDEQCGGYLHAARWLWPDRNFAGVLYNILRKKAPTRPKVLKNETISKAKIDTPAYIYIEAIREQFPDWTIETIEQEYGDKIAELAEKPNTYFARVPIYRGTFETDVLAQNIYHTGMEMINKDTVMYPCPNFMSCGFCHFRGPCLTKNVDGDFATILNMEYKPREAAISFRAFENEE